MSSDKLFAISYKEKKIMKSTTKTLAIASGLLLLASIAAYFLAVQWQYVNYNVTPSQTEIENALETFKRFRLIATFTFFAGLIAMFVALVFAVIRAILYSSDWRNRMINDKLNQFEMLEQQERLREYEKKYGVQQGPMMGYNNINPNFNNQNDLK